MPNIFDGLKVKAFDIVARTVGYDCFWQTHTARVMLRRPTEQESLSNINYDPRMSVIEYKAGDLPGLFDAVRDGQTETLEIDGVTYAVRDVQAIFDGDTYIAQIVKQ